MFPWRAGSELHILSSLRSRRKRGRRKGSENAGENERLVARDEGMPATKPPYFFFISTAASGRKILIGYF